MFDSLTSSADGLLVILYIIALIIFFLVGPHKVYEGIFWSLVGLGCYAFIHEMTFVTPDFTRTLFMGNWIVENRGMLLWSTKILAFALFFITPMTLWLNVAGVVRGTLWFFLKVVFLSAFFVCFGVVLFWLLYNSSGALGQVTIFPGLATDIPYIKNSLAYTWLVDKSYIILLSGFVLGFYKILFSHWISRVVLFSSVIYVKWNQIFWKKTFDNLPEGGWESHGHDESTHEDHGHDDHHSAHH